MSTHKPPTSDSQRLENLLVAWGSPDGEACDEDEAALGAVDYDTWAGEIQAKVKTQAAAERRTRAAAEAEAEARDGDTELDDRIRAEVDRAMAPYLGKAPPVVLAKMRELADRYFREHPDAVAILRALGERDAPVRSGQIWRAPDEDESESAGRKRKV